MPPEQMLCHYMQRIPAEFTSACLLFYNTADGGVARFKHALMGALTFRHVGAPGLSDLRSVEKKRFVRVISEVAFTLFYSCVCFGYGLEKWTVFIKVKGFVGT